MRKVMTVIASALMGAALGAVTIGKAMNGALKKIQKGSDKHLALFLMMNQWVKVKQEGKNLAAYFERIGYKRIAIYGMSYAGETLVDELKKTGIIVAYGIDKCADLLYADVDIITMYDDLEPVDAIIVTAITFYDEIKKELSKKIDCPILSLEDVLYEV